jgi:hypothetical protein
MKQRIIVLGIIIGLTVLLAQTLFASEYEELKQEMVFLKSRMVELEARLEQYERRDDHVSAKQAHDHQHHQHGSAHHDHGFNIDIGHKHHHLDIHHIQIHGGLDLRYVDTQQSKHKFFVHEAELGIGADLTDWLEALIVFTKHDGEEVEIEQAYGKLKIAEVQTVVKAGKFWVNFGPENRAGFFDRRTVTPSAMRSGFFGHENWADEGLEVSYKLPFDFESTVTVAALNGNNEKTFGDGSDTFNNNNMVAAFNMHNALETSWGTFTTGGSYARGKWDQDDHYSVDLYGLDAAWKLGNFDVLGEYMYRDKETLTGDIKGSGFYVLSAYTWPLKWKYLQDVEFLFAYGESDPEKIHKERRYSPQITFGLNDLAKIRVIYEIRESSNAAQDNNRLIAQFAYHF